MIYLKISLLVGVVGVFVGHNCLMGNRAGGGWERQVDSRTGVDEIAELLQTQVDCWNRGDIDGFMDTYWESEELTFCSSGKITRGWQATKDRYKNNYDTPEKMGHLEFADLEITRLAENVALVIGSWKLSFAEQTEKPPVSGKYSLVLKVIDTRWKIIHDHTSVAE